MNLAYQQRLLYKRMVVIIFKKKPLCDLCDFRQKFSVFIQLP